MNHNICYYKYCYKYTLTTYIFHKKVAKTTVKQLLYYTIST